MDTLFNDNLPIYIQIMKKFTEAIVSGEMKAGCKVASVRELAEAFQVNPNTMQRALSELEREGLLKSNRTSGRFVTEDKNLIDKIRLKMAEECVDAFIKEMNSLGYTKDGIKSFFDVNAGEKVS